LPLTKFTAEQFTAVKFTAAKFTAGEVYCWAVCRWRSLLLSSLPLAKFTAAKFTNMSDLASGEILTPLGLWYLTTEYAKHCRTSEVLTTTYNTALRLRPKTHHRHLHIKYIPGLPNCKCGTVRKYCITVAFSTFRCKFYRFQTPDHNDSSIIVIRPKHFSFYTRELHPCQSPYNENV
jgi:hypothetical protein